MKYLEVILVVLATVLIYESQASLSTALDRLEKDVNNTVAFLQHYKTDLAVDGNKKFDDALKMQKNKIASAVNQTLQEIQNEVQEANNEGHNADECNVAAESDVNDARSKVLPVLEKCFEDNKPDWVPVQNDTEGLIAAGGQLLNRIGEIREECVFNSTHTEICIALRLPQVAGAVALYKFGVGQLQKEVATTTVDGFKAVGRCSGLPLITFKIELKNARHNAMECIKSSQGTTANVLEI